MRMRRDAGLIARSLTGFDELPVKLYIRFDDLDAYENSNKELMSILNNADEGPDQVFVYLRCGKAV